MFPESEKRAFPRDLQDDVCVTKSSIANSIFVGQVEGLYCVRR